MLVIKIELWPYGDEAKAKEIGRTYLWNDGTGNRDYGNYGVAVCAQDDYVIDKDSHPVAKAEFGGKVKQHSRMDNVWVLVLKGLASAFPKVVLDFRTKV